jgi:hypothetical protein
MITNAFAVDDLLHDGIHRVNVTPLEINAVQVFYRDQIALAALVRASRGSLSKLSLSWVDANWPIFQTTVLGVIEQIKTWFDTNGATIFAGIVVGASFLIATVMSAVQIIWPAIQSAFSSIISIAQTLGQHLAALGIGWDTLGAVVGVVAATIAALFTTPSSFP